MAGSPRIIARPTTRSPAACRRARVRQGQAFGGAEEAPSLTAAAPRRRWKYAVGTEECSRRGSNKRMECKGRPKWRDAPLTKKAPYKPYAGKPPVRFGGRGGQKPSLPLSSILRRRLVARLLGLVQLEFFRDRSRDARPRAQPLIIGFHHRPFCQFDWRGRHGPVDDGDEIGVGDAEMVEQEFAAFEIVLEIIEPRQALAEDVGLHLGRRLLVEHRHEQSLVQFGADEAEPLMQAAAFHAGSG